MRPAPIVAGSPGSPNIMAITQEDYGVGKPTRLLSRCARPVGKGRLRGAAPDHIVQVDRDVDRFLLQLVSRLGYVRRTIPVVLGSRADRPTCRRGSGDNGSVRSFGARERIGARRPA